MAELKLFAQFGLFGLCLFMLYMHIKKTKTWTWNRVIVQITLVALAIASLIFVPKLFPKATIEFVNVSQGTAENGDVILTVKYETKNLTETDRVVFEACPDDDFSASVDKHPADPASKEFIVQISNAIAFFRMTVYRGKELVATSDVRKVVK